MLSNQSINQSIKQNNPEVGFILAKLSQHEYSILTAYSEYRRFLPASLTKILTLMLVWDKIKSQNINIEQTYCEICPNLLGSSEFYRLYNEGDKVPLIQLIKATLIFSQNESAYSLAIWHSGSEKQFVEVMNRKAQEIGLKDSLFYSSTGLRRKGHTTVQDMFQMAYVFVNHYPELFQLASIRVFQDNGKTFQNTNRLLHKYPNLVVGLKTGNLVGLGSNLLNVFKYQDQTYISVVLMAPTIPKCAELSEQLMQLVVETEQECRANS